jgi:superfamily II DNA/RNA helicase
MPKDNSHRSSRRHHSRDHGDDAPYPHEDSKHRRRRDAVDDEPRHHKRRDRRGDSNNDGQDADEFGRSSSRRHKRRDSNNADDELPSNNNNNNNNSDDTSPCPTFDSMNLKPTLLRGIYAYGFEKPSAIQQRAIRPIVCGRDVIAQSQSGTGKTAVFSISSLQLLDERSNDPQVLILSPTRELAEQTQRVVSSLGDFMNVKCHACIGGKSLGEDRKVLQQGVQVLSGTPGRVYDLIKRGDLTTRALKAFIIDEADEMLNKGFKEQVRMMSC